MTTGFDTTSTALVDSYDIVEVNESKSARPSRFSPVPKDFNDFEAIY
eukprot:CAMPEP_0182432362 /NCGR_PEP_ID=MMETSP1167-20130531/55747_1 /TAXON_ID=2988 /ORGANISM="Mallomonas Sp, Strain CCMP3275" /LENGTH=46 /DNA_ID= /DNA_START= /DNA_END= /DNA_ORIENTATION=